MPKSITTKDNNNYQTSNPSYIKKKHVILLGSSIGRAWNISALPERIDERKYKIEYCPGGGYNKSKRLESVISQVEKKPDAIFIKQS